MATPAILALGANLGDRLAALQGAIDLLAQSDGVEVVAVSGVYETDPVGGPDQGDFLNAVIAVATDRDPRGLLEACHAAERAYDRQRQVRWGPRTLDVDIVSFGDVVSTDPELTLPHPRAAQRAFVCVPWLDVAPHAEIPGVGAVARIAADLDTHGVRCRSDLSLVVPGRVR